MSSLPPVQSALLELSKVDAKAAGLQSELGALQAQLTAMREGKNNLQQALEGIERALADAEKARNEAQHELRSSSVQIDQSRDKMSRVRTERENNAVGRELEELRRIVRDQEDEIRKLDTLISDYRGKLELTRGEHEAASAALGEQEGSLGGRAKELEQELAAGVASRAEIGKQLPPALLRKYELIRQKRGSGVATTSDGTCGACHISLPPQLFNTMRRQGAPDQCPSCNRIMVYLPPVSAS